MPFYLFLLPFVLSLPLFNASPVGVTPSYTPGNFLLFKNNLRHKTIVRNIISVPSDENVNLSTFSVRPGLNGDPCESESDCQGDRLCLGDSINDLPEHCTPEHSYCFCLSFHAMCATSSDCDEGEVCFRFAHTPVNMCLSEQIAPTVDGLVIDDGNAESTVSALAENGSENNASVSVENGSAVSVEGLNGDPCSSSADCQGDRQCIFGSGSGLPELCTPDAPHCFCFSSDAACSTISDCDPGEICYAFPEDVIKLCLSEQYAADLNDLVETEIEPTPQVTPSDEDECDSAADCETGEECGDRDGYLTCIPSVSPKGAGNPN